MIAADRISNRRESCGGRAAIAVVVERLQVPKNRKEVSPATSDSTAIILNHREVVERCVSGVRTVCMRSPTGCSQSQSIAAFRQPVAVLLATDRRLIADPSAIK